MRVLVIHDADEVRALILSALSEGLPGADVETWDPSRRGLPTERFDWARYELALLDEVPAAFDGINCLIAWRKGAWQMPPTVVLGSRNDASLTARARAAGAADYVPKSALTPARAALFANLVTACPDARPAHALARSFARTQPLNLPAIGEPTTEAVAIPGYRVLRKIAAGGMSKVYLAERASDGLQLVLKMLDPKLNGNPQFRQRFVREYEILRKISNRHIVEIYDQTMTDDHGYIAMEYFEGGDLKQRLRRGMSPDAVLRALAQIAIALDAVHRAGVVHRDLKPQNIMYRDHDTLAILDFGLAREMDATATLTQKGMVFATPLYMSPEQCLGIEHDPRGDLYSVGIMLYEMLTGLPPFISDNAPDLAYQHVHAPIPRLPAKVLGFQALINRLLAKKPQQRFDSARALLQTITH